MHLESAPSPPETKASFLARLSPIMAPSHVRLVELGYVLSKNYHHGQTRMERALDGTPVRYFEHPRRSTLSLIDEVGVDDWRVIVTGLCHDCLEDTHMSPELIEHCFGADVARWILSLTKTEPRDGYYERLKRYGTWQAMLVKLADNLDNMRSVGAGDVAFQA